MKYKNSYLLNAYCLFLAFIPLAASAQTAVLSDTLRGAMQDGSVSGSILGDFFGDHVAVDNEWLIVGAPREDVDLNGDSDTVDPGERDAGAIYIHRRTDSGAFLHQKIEGEGNNIISSGDRFGAGVTLAGDWLFVGAANDNDFPGVDPIAPNTFSFAGKVYVYKYDAGADTWNLTQKLTSDAPNSSGSFGARTDSSHVELFSFGKNPDARIALIGEVENTSGLAARLHVFREKKGVWKRVQIATSPSGAVGTSFADSVTSIGDLALVPEHGFDFPTDSAQVHVYRIDRNGIIKVKGKLQPVQSLESPSGDADVVLCGTLAFGTGLGAGGDTVAIADPCDSSVAPASGVVHVYRVDDDAPLSFVQTLPHPDPQPFAFFGGTLPTNGKQTISASSEVIVVGSPQSFGFAVLGPQDVYLFGRQNDGTFSETDNLPTPEPPLAIPGFDGYGQSVTLGDDDDLYIGQLGSFFEGGGRVFVYQVDVP